MAARACVSPAPGIAPAPAPAPLRVCAPARAWRSLYAPRERLFLAGWWEEAAREGGRSPQLTDSRPGGAAEPGRGPRGRGLTHSPALGAATPLPHPPVIALPSLGPRLVYSHSNASSRLY